MFRLVQSVSAVEIVYKRKWMKYTVLLRSFWEFCRTGRFLLKTIVETN